MNSQDAMNYLTAIAEQRRVAREAIIMQIRKLSDFLKKNYRIGDLMCMPDGQLCVVLRALEHEFAEAQQAHRKAQTMGKWNPTIGVLLLMVALCFAGCSASKNAARIEQCPTFPNGAYGQR